MIKFIGKKMVYQFMLIELAKIIYEMHSRKAKKIKFEIHKRTGKFVVYFDDSIYKDISLKYGFTIAKELYKFVSGKNNDEEIEKDMNEEISISDIKHEKVDLKKFNLPLPAYKSIEYSHKMKPGEIFEVSLEWKSLKPMDYVLDRLEDIREKANCDSYEVKFVPKNEMEFDEYEQFIVEEINLKKGIVYFESGARSSFSFDEIENIKQAKELIENFIVSKLVFKKENEKE